MSKIAVISDIHGNLPALEAVLQDIKERSIEHIICLGDIAGKGPSSVEVFELIQENCQQIVKGNWDHFMVEKDELPFSWHRQQLGEDRLNILEALPTYVEFYISGQLIRLCHASPNSIFHRTHLGSKKEDRMKLFELTETSTQVADVVGYGDIHGAHVEYFEGKTIFNTGSVGNPLELTQASYAILEGEYNSKTLAPLTISIARVPYDIERAVKHASQSSMPDIDAYIRELRTAVYRGSKSK